MRLGSNKKQKRVKYFGFPEFIWPRRKAERVSSTYFICRKKKKEAIYQKRERKREAVGSAGNKCVSISHRSVKISVEVSRRKQKK